MDFKNIKHTHAHTQAHTHTHTHAHTRMNKKLDNKKVQSNPRHPRQRFDSMLFKSFTSSNIDLIIMLAILYKYNFQTHFSSSFILSVCVIFCDDGDTGMRWSCTLLESSSSWWTPEDRQLTWCMDDGWVPIGATLRCTHVTS